MDFGSIDSKTNGSILYTLGLAQEEGIRFLGEGGIRIVPQLWMSYFNSEVETVSILQFTTAARYYGEIRADFGIASFLPP